LHFACRRAGAFHSQGGTETFFGMPIAILNAPVRADGSTYASVGERALKMSNNTKLVKNPAGQSRNMKPTEDLVRELVDREAIRDLSNRYCDCLYRNDLDGLVSLFTQNATFLVKDYESEVVTRGRAKLKKMFARLVSDVNPKPLIHALVVELRSENTATGRCYVELRSDKVQVEGVGSGYYEDEYAKIGAEWKFASRRLFAMDSTISLRTFKVT
jgi:ketosteroid isomerase-like protein